MAAVTGTSRVTTGTVGCRYAGAMLLHAYLDRVGAQAIFATLAGGPARRYDDLAVLCTATLGFALGMDTVEGAKHLRRAEAGAALGLGAVPELKTLRTRLGALADGTDPLALQRAFAARMLAADPAGQAVHFVDDHFVPYAGARPVGKGWNTKRRHAQPGRDDTLLVDARGRAVVFGSGEPTGLSRTLPGVLAQLREVIGPHAPVLLGFDRGAAPTRRSSPRAGTRARTGSPTGIDPRNAIARWMQAVPIARASTAGTREVKNVHTFAPRPDWEISSPQGTPSEAAAFTYACASSIACGPSKSAANHQQVASASSGYRPMNRSSVDRRWAARTSVVNGSGRRSHNEPLRNGSRTTGDQPLVPFRGFSQYLAYTSPRAANSRAYNASFTSAGDEVVTKPGSDSASVGCSGGASTPSVTLSRFRNRCFSARSATNWRSRSACRHRGSCCRGSGMRVRPGRACRPVPPGWHPCRCAALRRERPRLRMHGPRR